MAHKPMHRMNERELAGFFFDLSMGSDKAWKSFWRSMFELHAEIVGQWAYAAFPVIFEEDVQTRPFASLKVGDSESAIVEVHEHCLIYFGRSVGDYNKVHFDKKHATKTIFKKPIAHGMWSASLFSPIFASRLPGEGSVYREQNTRFEAPIHVGDVLDVKVTITELDPKSLRIKFLTQVHNQDGKLMVDGTAVIYPAEKFVKKDDKEK